MGLEERALGSTSATIAYGLTGILSMIPSLMEISLDRKLNENKTALEKNAFYPDLVARHIQNNGAVFIGCSPEALEPVRQELTQGSIPFITVNSSMIEDESKRPPHFYTVVIRDIDGNRAADLLKGLVKDLSRENGEPDLGEGLEEEDLERGLDEEGTETAAGDGGDGEEEPEAGEEGLEGAPEEEPEDDGEDGEEEKKEKKKAAAKQKAEKRKERRRREQEQKRRDEKRRDDSIKRDQAERRSNAERRESGHQAEERRREEDDARRQATPAGSSTFAGEPSWTDYRDAYAIRASEIEEQCERYAKAELMRRELEKMKLTGQDTGEDYDLLRNQYRSVNDDIRAHHDRFQSVGKSGWQEYAMEAVRQAREATTEDLEKHSWNVPESGDYLKRNPDGSYGEYTREEKKEYFDRRYRNGEVNVTLNGYAEETVRHEALRRQEELISASRKTDTQDGMEHYRSLLDHYDVTDQEVSRYRSWETVKQEREASGKALEKTEKALEDQGFSGVREYREKLESSLKDTRSGELSAPAPSGMPRYQVSAAPDPSSMVKGPDGRPVLDFREQRFSRASYEALPQEEAKKPGGAMFSFSRAGAGEPAVQRIANGYALRACMEAQGRGGGQAVGGYGAAFTEVHAAPSPGYGGILIDAGVSVFGSGDYCRKGTKGQEAFEAGANSQPVTQAYHGARPNAVFTGGTEQTKAAAEKALAYGSMPQSGPDSVRVGGNQPIHMRKIQAVRGDSLQRAEVMRARAAHAMTSMMGNRYLAMTVKQGMKNAVQSGVGETEAGRMAYSAINSVRLPTHMIKQKLLNAGRTSLDQGDMAMSALNRHIIRSRASEASVLKGEALEKFAAKSGITMQELQAVKGDKDAMERLVAMRYAGTFRTPGKEDMDGIIRAVGIRGDLVKEDAIGTSDILGFLNHHGETTLAERSRALKNAGDGLDGLTGSQKRLVESLFSQDKFLDPEDMKAFLAKNGIRGELAEKLSGGNWAANEDILAALQKAGISTDVSGALMKELNGVSVEDRSAMMGLFQLYAGDSLDGFDMDKFRDLLNVLDVDQALKDEIGKNYIHLSHMSIDDIKKLLAKYKGNPEAEAFLSRLMNEKVCLVLGRNREMSRFELMNGIESMMFNMARGTDAMNGFSQVTGLGRGMARVAKSGYRLLYNMAFRRMTKPISIGKLKVAPADLTGANLKAMAVNSVKQTKVAAKFSQILHRKVPGGVKRTVNHVLHPGRFIGQAIGRKVEWILAKHGVDTLALKAGMQAVAGKLTAAAASLSEILLIVFVIILIIIALLMAYESIDLGGSSSENNNYSAAYVSAAEGKDAFAQEVVDMLRGYTDDFIDELNNAQYNRGMYAGMNGYNTNEDVGAFEAGAYQVVFRGPDGEPIDDITSVDLNNSKDIISMASVFIPTVFTKPGENASQQAIAEYEKDKEHFKDYCTFLWAASHQISIEEYHPGNASNPDANDASGLTTDAQTGKCQMDYGLNGDQGAGVNWWIAKGASPTSGEICGVCSKEGWYDTDIAEHACTAKPAADPCTHGHWETVSTPIRHRACKGHHHHCSKHDYWYSCADKNRTKWDEDHNVYKRIWVCDGHMGAVVYATIGRISRMPNFGAATDYDFDNPETYGGSGGIYSYFGGSGSEGRTAFHGDSYALSDAQLRYLAAMCMGEQRSCATNEVTMRYQASLMANVYELYGKRKGLSLYEYLTLLPTQSKNGVRGWFATTSHTYADKNAGAVSAQCVEWIRDVLCNGNRITKANEQGTLVTGFVKAVYQGKTYTGNAMKNESIYVSGETILYTSGGQACLFEAFPGGHPAGCGTPVVDPFAIIIN